MKSEMLTLSPAAVLGIWFIGFSCGCLLYGKGGPIDYFIIAFLLLMVRNDSREPWLQGQWQRGWFMWRRTGPCE